MEMRINRSTSGSGPPLMVRDKATMAMNPAAHDGLHLC
jgi:hypothetical protein